jgi:preprotein translocase subunit SecG
VLILNYRYVKILLLIRKGGVVMKLFATIFLIIASLVLIASILLQSGKSAGLSGGIAGGAESIWGKNKGRSYEGMLEKLTSVSAGLFIVMALILTALQ